MQEAYETTEIKPPVTRVGVVGWVRANLFNSVFSSFFTILTIYFFQGMGIVAFFFEKKQLPRSFRIMLYALIALQQVLLLVIIGLGVFDLWLNFRKIGIKKD